MTPVIDLDYSYVPNENMVTGLQNYFERHIKPGDFLTALLENDFAKVMRNADPINRGRLDDWARWVHNEPPMHTNGSKEAVKAWLLKRDYLDNE